MSVVKQCRSWFFAQQEPSVRWWRVILWWELRRIPFNVLIGVYGVMCLAIFFWGILGSGILRPGEDAVEPMALVAAPFAVNICYTFGWLVELVARLVRPSLTPRLGPRLLRLGLGFSMFVISIPALYWGGYRVLQLVHVVH
jgi:hypothetical protein